jgi:hypothetical protein
MTAPYHAGASQKRFLTPFSLHLFHQKTFLTPQKRFLTPFHLFVTPFCLMTPFCLTPFCPGEGLIG